MDRARARELLTKSLRQHCDEYFRGDRKQTSVDIEAFNLSGRPGEGWNATSAELAAVLGASRDATLDLLEELGLLDK